MGLGDRGSKARIRQLQYTIAVYRRRKKAGEPWPDGLKSYNA